MIKKIRRLLTVLLIITIIAASFFLYGVYISVEHINMNYETIESTKLPKDMKNISIAFLSDIQYNGFMNKNRLEPMIRKINDANPDVVIFGGDLFDSTLTNIPDQDKQVEILNLLKALDAPLGKFAVLGEQDETSENIKTTVKNILFQADFELIENSSLRIRNNSNASITLFGIDSMINGHPDIEKAFSNINANEFNIAISHCPDIITQLPTTAIDLMLSGHSHGSQIRVPFFGPISTIDGAKTYTHGTEKIGNTLLHISNGLGTTNYDMRLFSQPEVLIYRLIPTK